MDEKTAPAGELTDSEIGKDNFSEWTTEGELADGNIDAVLESIHPIFWDVPSNATNAFARAIIKADRALRESPAVGDVAMPVVAYLHDWQQGQNEAKDWISQRESNAYTAGSSNVRPLVKQSDAQAALAAKDAEIAALTAERDAAQMATVEWATRCEKVMASTATLLQRAKTAEQNAATLKAERDALLHTADMFWDHDDAERCHGSIDEILNDTWNNGSLEVGAEFTVQQAIRLPNVKVRVTAIDEENGDVAYEEIDAAMTKEPK